MKRTPSQLEASGLAFAGYTLWVLTDTSLKIVGTSALPFYEILALVGAAIVLALLLRALWRKDVAALWPKRLAPQLWRACLDAGNNIGVVIAIRHLPLALFYILVFFAPIVTTLLGAVLLGEALTWKRSLAIAAGFAGVVVAVNPFGVARPRDWTGYIACAVCVACFSTNMVWTRRMMQTESQESLTFISSAVMMVAGGLAMLWHAEPFSLRFGAVFAATGPICVLGSFCFYTALKHAPASTVAQFHYSQLLTGALIAYLIWHEKLTGAMWLGAVLIVGAGLYTAASSYNARAEIEATEHSL